MITVDYKTKRGGLLNVGRGEQATIPGLERRQVPGKRHTAEDRGLSGLPLSLDGQEAMRTKQGRLF